MENWFLFLIPLLYFLSEILSRAKSSPEAEPPPEMPDYGLKKFPPKMPQQQVSVPVAASPKAPLAAKLADSSKPQAGQEEGGWDNKLHPSVVLNGVIFAEILQPPRSMRPIEARFTRRR